MLTPPTQIWCISRFVKPPSKKSKKSTTKAENGIADAIALANGVALASVHAQSEEGKGETLIPSLKTPATPLGGMSGGQTPVGGDNVNVNGNGVSEPDKVAQALLQRAARATEEDGAVLYSESCFVLFFSRRVSWCDITAGRIGWIRLRSLAARALCYPGCYITVIRLFS
jgi:hypothetical protein